MKTDQEAEQKQFTTFLEVFILVYQRHPDFLFKALKYLVLTQPQLAVHTRDFLAKATTCTALDVVETFPLYIPKSAGDYQQKAPLTIQTINQTFPFLSTFAQMTCGRSIEVRDIETFPSSPEEKTAAQELKKCLDAQGSDKANYHNYHHVYGPLLKDRAGVRGVLEVGMGTNNTDVVSNMGVAGKPGASLRAFRAFLATANIYGADIDKRILFSEDRIKTYFVDQTDPASFSELNQNIPSDLDLVIDDGLHSPNANIQTLGFGLTKIKVNGWVVVEDIGLDAIPVWEVVAALLPVDKYKSYLLRAAGEVVVFAVQRLN